MTYKQLLLTLITLFFIPFSTVAYSGHQGVEPTYYGEVKSLFDNRCVVCHGCYDAPCQLKLSSPEGIFRGASKDKIYHGTRLLADQPTRLFIDAHSVNAWRDKGFFFSRRGKRRYREKFTLSDAGIEGAKLVIYRINA